MIPIKELDSKLGFLLVGIALILVIPLMAMKGMDAGFLEAYLSTLWILFLGPFILPVSVLTWEFDMFPFSMWYVLLFWTLPPIVMGVALAGDENEYLRKYSGGFVTMLGVSVVALLLGILGALAFGMY